MSSFRERNVEREERGREQPDNESGAPDAGRNRLGGWAIAQDEVEVHPDENAGE